MSFPARFAPDPPLTTGSTRKSAPAFIATLDLHLPPCKFCPVFRGLHANDGELFTLSAQIKEHWANFGIRKTSQDVKLQEIIELKEDFKSQLKHINEYAGLKCLYCLVIDIFLNRLKENSTYL